MKVLKHYLCIQEINKTPLPEYTGKGIRFEDGFSYRSFSGTFTSQEVVQLVRNQEAGKTCYLSRWKKNYFNVPEFWNVIVYHHWYSGWTIRFYTWAEGQTN